MRDTLTKLPVRRFRRAIAAALLSLTTAACASPRAEPAVTRSVPAPDRTDIAAAVDRALAAVRAEYAFDRRVARFDAEAHSMGDRIIITGETTVAEAPAALHRALAGLAVPYDDRIVVLPDPALNPSVWALANNSVANMRTEPGHGAELGTQALLGAPLRVLRQQGGFYLVQTSDGYLAWADGGGIHRIDEAAYARYRAAPRIVYLRMTGAALSEPRADAGPVADLVLGAMLELAETGPRDVGYYRTRMPDGRIAWVARAEAMPYDAWIETLDATESSLVATARSLMGLPYLWGGNSTKGVDCSGFTKTVYQMNGLILPRDASQQVHIGVLVDDRADFDRLRPGDLLFFGRPATADEPERVVHVALWIGDQRFIHSSGRVRIDSMDPAAPDYDEYNRRRYLRSKRVLDNVTGVKLLRDGAFTF
jgi:gamma-D-glutamyl-L-lysine dipeptidyl-peptidase